MGQACISDKTAVTSEPHRASSLDELAFQDVAQSVLVASGDAPVMGRVNSEPSSPQLVPVAHLLKTITDFSSPAVAMAASYTFEGPLTPVGPLHRDDIVLWLSGNNPECSSTPCLGSTPPSAFEDRSPQIDYEETVRQFEVLGHNYDHFEDNSVELLAQAQVEIAAERKKLDGERRKEQSGGRRLTVLEKISLALTGKA